MIEHVSKRHNLILVMLAGLFLTSCDLIGSIFNLGLWTGIIIVLVILALIIFIIIKLFQKL